MGFLFDVHVPPAIYKIDLTVKLAMLLISPFCQKVITHLISLQREILDIAFLSLTHLGHCFLSFSSDLR